MRSDVLLAAFAAGALLFGSGTLAYASAAPDDSTSAAAAIPGSHESGDDEDDGQGLGPPPDRGRPEGVGQGRALALGHGSGGPDGPPELPPQASDRAREAVQLAFERQQAIRDRVAQIHELPPGPGKGQAVSALMQHFGQLFSLTSDVVDGSDT